MSLDLTAATTPRRVDAGTFEADVPDGWQQGRGAFGGLVVGLLTRALMIVDADGGEAKDPSRVRSLRSLTAAICGPVLAGPNTIRVERLRTGTGVSTLAARIEKDGEVLAHAVGLFGRDRAPGTDFVDVAAPDPMRAPWREVPVLDPRDFVPPFAKHFEFRPIGALPFTSHPDAAIAGWVRARDAGLARDAAYVATMVDAYWPALFARMSAFRPMATVAYTLEILNDLEGVAPDAPLFYTAVDRAARGGYVSEERTLFREDGKLLARNHQTFTIIQ